MTLVSSAASMHAQVPPVLKPGDLLYVISPSGGLQPSEAFAAGLEGVAAARLPAAFM